MSQSQWRHGPAIVNIWLKFELSHSHNRMMQSQGSQIASPTTIGMVFGLIVCNDRLLNKLILLGLFEMEILIGYNASNIEPK
ncbi:hypothetical protein [Phyllobacterium sp. SB3]|uniref:hypothetical protein n=1 Tax=Phyllobacterium sp. SB3 TaxID=3156073 RepID=UPI0032AF1B7A